MTLSLKHPFTSGVVDGADASLVQPSNWNAEHTITMATAKVLGRATAGTGAVEEISVTGTGSVALATSPTLVTPTLGAASATSLTLSGALSGVTTLGASGIVSLTNTTASTSTTSGALVVGGGLGVAGAIYSGGDIKTAASKVIGYSDAALSRSTTSMLFLGNGSDADAAGTLALTKVLLYPNAWANLTNQTPGVVQIGTGATTGAGGSLLLTNLTASGVISTTSTTASTSTTTGALVVGGGVGIGGAVYIGGGLSSVSTGNNPFKDTITVQRYTGGVYGTIATFYSGSGDVQVGITVDNPGVIGTVSNHDFALKAYNTTVLRMNSSAVISQIGTGGAIVVEGTTASTSFTTGAVRIAGGVGIGGAVNTGGCMFSAGQVVNGLQTSFWGEGLVFSRGSTGGFVVVRRDNNNIAGYIYSAAGEMNVLMGGGQTVSVSTGGILSISATTASTSTTSGALVVGGGLGVAGAAYLGGALISNGEVISHGGGLIAASGSRLLYIRQVGGQNRIDSYDYPITSTVPLYLNALSFDFNIADSSKATINSSGNFAISTTTASTSTTSGAFQCVGGGSFQAAFFVGGSGYFGSPVATQQIKLSWNDAADDFNYLTTQGGSLGLIIKTQVSGVFKIQRNTTVDMTLSSAGAFRWHAYGAGTLTTDASGNITAVSDARLKDRVGDFTRSLIDLRKIGPASVYDYRPDSGLVGRGAGWMLVEGAGMVAAFPEAIGRSRDGFLTFADRPVLAACVNAVIDVDDKVQKLIRENVALRERVDQLQSSVH